MNENEKTVEELQLDQIEQLKQKMEKMVDPTEHAKLKEQYERLLNDYVNKRPAPQAEKPVIRPVKEVAKALASVRDGDISNRDYIKLALEYREAYMAQFGTDPFTDFGAHGSGEPTADSEEVAEKLKKLLDDNETPVGFRIAMNESLRDDPQLAAMINKRKLQKARA